MFVFKKPTAQAGSGKDLQDRVDRLEYQLAEEQRNARPCAECRWSLVEQGQALMGYYRHAGQGLVPEMLVCGRPLGLRASAERHHHRTPSSHDSRCGPEGLYFERKEADTPQKTKEAK